MFEKGFGDNFDEAFEEGSSDDIGMLLVMQTFERLVNPFVQLYLMRLA